MEDVEDSNVRSVYDSEFPDNVEWSKKINERIISSTNNVDNVLFDIVLQALTVTNRR